MCGSYGTATMWLGEIQRWNRATIAATRRSEFLRSSRLS
ncbi:Uncharacterised protein [Mycobacteroides abscessus subsp. abscessus]|nr:Uncharacterised protein [Mycobacteroides abscessus subsp. abscessus]